MDINPLLTDLFTDYTLRTVALGTALLGLVSGALGAFALLRKQSLMGDAISHAALPGVVLAFMLTGLKGPLVLMSGAALAGIAGVLVVVLLTRTTRIKQDSSLGIILAVFFGFGLMLLTFLQNNPDARQAGLNHFLFGQAATLLAGDVLVMAIFGGAALALMLIFWKEFKLLSFDRDFGASLGLPMQRLEILITFLLVIAIVIGLQAVGVVLMSAMVVAPAAAARQWTDRLGVMVALSAFFRRAGRRDGHADQHDGRRPQHGTGDRALHQRDCGRFAALCAAAGHGVGVVAKTTTISQSPNLIIS
jgi:manganese/zinc/iron transport system permease protein